MEQFRSNPVCRERFGGKIPIAIRCDNSRDTEMIPSDMSDFNLYGGLYRYVNLVYVPAFHPERIRINASTDEKGQQGEVSIELQMTEHAPQKMDLRILSPEGKEIKQVLLPAPSQAAASSCRFTLKRPKLWSPDSPNLYTCIIEITGNGDTLRTTERFGFRHFRFEEKVLST